MKFTVCSLMKVPFGNSAAEHEEDHAKPRSSGF